MTYFNPNVKAQIASLLDFMDHEKSESIVVIQKQSSKEFQRGQSQTSHMEGKKYEIIDLINDDSLILELIEDFIKNEGLAGFQHADKLAFGKGAGFLSQKNVVITTRRQPSRRPNQEPTAKNKDQGQLKTEDLALPQEKVASKDSKKTSGLIDEEQAAADTSSSEVESFTSFETIPEEIYQKFLTLFKKITRSEASEKERTTDKAHEGIISKAKEDTAKTKESTASPTQIKTVKQTSSKEEGVEKLEQRGSEDRARVAAAKEKDEKAKEKLRHFIETDLAKSETKAAEIDRISTADQEIDEAILYEMLENDEIDQNALNKILDCANVDEKFLDEMLKDQSIDNRAYEKLMNMISPKG